MTEIANILDSEKIYSNSPLVKTQLSVLSNQECEHFINISKNSLTQALVSEAKQGIISKGRTGRNTWIRHKHDEITQQVGERIANIVGLPLENAEAFQIIYYGVSQEYRQHYDSWDHDGSEKTLRCMKRGGARLKTALCYLNDVKKGGGTKMTKLNITIPPIKGSLLIFNNTYSITNHTRHPLSEHAGLPVEEGEKYAFNLWFKECNHERLYKDYNPDYYKNIDIKNKYINTETTTPLSSPQLSPQLHINGALNNSEIYNNSGFIEKNVCEKIVALSNFNTNTRRDAWLKLEVFPELTKKIELLTGIKKDHFENINIVEYKPNILHNRHFVAYDMKSEKGKKYTNVLGQRIYTISIALSNNILVKFPNINRSSLLNTGDIIIYNNVHSIDGDRNPNLERTIINNNDNNGYIANIYIRQKTKNGETIVGHIQEKKNVGLQIVELENYMDTLNDVMKKFKQDEITQRWNGYESFKYNFKGDFNKFKNYIKRYNTIREQRPCLNKENLDIKYSLDSKLPIQIVNNVIDAEFLSILQSYYKDTIDSSTWELGDKQSNRYKSHNEPMSRFLHYEILPLIEKIIGKSMKPTYTYLSAYVKGADLPPHTDRADCEYTVSFVIDKPEGSNWNIYVHKPQQPVKHKGRYNIKPSLEECEPVDCDAGGLMLFQGTDHIHFREKLDHDYYNILLLHYCSI